MPPTKLTLRIFLITILLAALSGCASTHSENGVTIEKSASNPFKIW